MPRLELLADSDAPPERVLAAARDFSERRPELWPNIDPDIYTVHEVGDTFAEVTEGSRMLGRIWARERYEWQDPAVVRATVQDSNIFQPGGVWEIRATPRGGGSRVEVVNDRRPKGLKGRLIALMARLAGKRVLTADLRKTLSAIEASE